MGTERIRLTNSIVEKMKPRDRYYEVRDEVLRGLVVRVQPSGKRSYHFRYRTEAGEHKRLVVGDASALTVAMAREKAQELYADVIAGKDPVQERQAARAHTLESFLDGPYLERAHHRTAAAQIQRVKVCFADLLDKPMGEILPMRIEGWRAKRLKEGKKPGAISRDEDCLIGVLSAAARWGLIPKNPLAGMRRLKLDRGGKPRYLSPDELKALHNALAARDEGLRAQRDRFNKWRADRGHSTFPDLRKLPFADHVTAMVLVSLHTGLRRGELFNLKWGDVDMEGDNPSIVVRGAIAKSGRTRHIPMNATVQKTLADWRTMAPAGEYVFTSPKTGGPYDHVNTAWRSVCKAAGLEGTFRWHDMRHHFASMLVQRGVDLNTVRELLGHADLKMTLRYGHLAPGNMARAVALLESNIVPLKTNTQHG